MNKEFLEWLISYAQGFELWYMFHNWNGIKIANIEFSNKAIKRNLSENWLQVVYPLLLQRAIQGINKTELKINIYQNSYSVWISIKKEKKYSVNKTVDFYFKENPQKGYYEKIYKSEDEAKEAALKYIYEELK